MTTSRAPDPPGAIAAFRATGAQGPVTVALVGVEAELGEALAAVERMLLARKGQVASVVRLAPDMPEALRRARDCPLRVVLLGVAVGGPSGAAALGALLDEGTNTLAAAQAKPSREAYLRFGADMPHVGALWDRCPTAFDDPAGVADVLRGPVGAWLDAHVPVAAGEGAGLTAWEESYLRENLPGWVRGGHGALLNRREQSTLWRAQLYVGLRADVNEVWREEDGTVVFAGPEPAEARGSGRAARARAERVVASDLGEGRPRARSRWIWPCVFPSYGRRS